MSQITLSQALAWRKTLVARHTELVSLRNENGTRERRWIGSTDKEIVKEPLYDPKALDKLVTKLANEIRKLDDAVKATNAATAVAGYTQDDTVLGELS